jgi:hypothetical protein
MHSAAGAGYCTPTYFIDGLRWDAHALGEPIDPPHQPPGSGAQSPPFTTTNVKQIEVYGQDAVRPLRFEGDPNCGVVVLWTK